MTEEIWTLLAFLFCIGLFVVAHLQSRRPYLPGRLPLVPWTGVQFAALILAVLLVGHLISLWSGTPFVGRRGF